MHKIYEIANTYNIIFFKNAILTKYLTKSAFFCEIFNTHISRVLNNMCAGDDKHPTPIHNSWELAKNF
jgi:hypothetical protein